MTRIGFEPISETIFWTYSRIRTRIYNSNYSSLIRIQGWLCRHILSIINCGSPYNKFIIFETLNITKSTKKLKERVERIELSSDAWKAPIICFWLHYTILAWRGTSCLYFPRTPSDLFVAPTGFEPVFHRINNFLYLNQDFKLKKNGKLKANKTE